MAVKYTKWLYIRPNGRKIDQHCPFQVPPKCTQIGIFGLKIYYLATLALRYPCTAHVATAPDRELAFNPREANFFVALKRSLRRRNSEEQQNC
jgi:hypothetical protein